MVLCKWLNRVDRELKWITLTMNLQQRVMGVTKKTAIEQPPLWHFNLKVMAWIPPVAGPFRHLACRLLVVTPCPANGIVSDFIETQVKDKIYFRRPDSRFLTDVPALLWMKPSDGCYCSYSLEFGWYKNIHFIRFTRGWFPVILVWMLIFHVSSIFQNFLCAFGYQLWTSGLLHLLSDRIYPSSLVVSASLL